MIKKKIPLYRHLPFYLYQYLIAAHLKLITSGKTLNFPRILQIQTQSFCNGQCTTCPYPIVSKKLDQGTMEWDLFSKIARESASEPLLSSVLFELHNEPLLDKRLPFFVEYSRKNLPDKPKSSEKRT